MPIRAYGWLPAVDWGSDTVWQRDSNGIFLAHNDHHNDHLYTTEHLSDSSSGQERWSAVRTAFGQIIVQAGVSTEYLLRMPGQWDDLVGKFAQNWNREYSSEIGSYQSVDPAFFPSAVDAFTYTSQNPVVRLDSTGRAWWNPVDWAVDGSAKVAEGQHFRSSTNVSVRTAHVHCSQINFIARPALVDRLLLGSAKRIGWFHG